MFWTFNPSTGRCFQVLGKATNKHGFWNVDGFDHYVQIGQGIFETQKDASDAYELDIAIEEMGEDR